MGGCGLRAGLGEVGGVASGRTPDHRHGWPPHAAATPRKPQALVSVSVVVKPPTVSFSDHEGQKQKNKKNQTLDSCLTSSTQIKFQYRVELTEVTELAWNGSI